MAKKMNTLEKMIAELCPEGVEFKALGEVLQRTKGTPITAAKMSEINRIGAPIKIFAGGKTVAYVDYGDIPGDDVLTKESVVVKSRGIIGFEYIDKPFSHKNEFWSYHSSNASIIIKYVYYYLINKESYFQSVGQKMSKMPQLSIPDTDKFLIPIPPLSIQEEIVRILDAFTTLEAELEAELEARKKQYKYYRDELLSFGEDVEWKTLGEVYEFQYGEGNTIPTSGGEYPVYGSNGIVGSHSKYNSEDAPVIGHIGAYAGIVNWASGKHFVTYNGVICRIKKGIYFRYGYHLLKKLNLRELAKDGSQPFVSYDKLKSVKVQLPNNDKQIEIARLLDKFDALVNDISVGLPAELNARCKQYEYYRNNLLTFKPLEENHA